MKHIRLTYNLSPITHNLRCYIHKLTLSLLFPLILFASALFSLCLINSSALAGWQIETVDSAEVVVGYGTSLAFDGSGNSAISYYSTDEDFNDTLKYARFNAPNPGWNITTIAAEGMGVATSLAFDASGNPGILFHNDDPIDRFKYAHSTDGGVTWPSGNIETAVATEDAGGFHLAFDGSDNPAISYSEDGNLKYAHRIGAIWNIESVDSDMYEGYTSLAFDGSDNPAISYDSGDGNLKYAHFNGTSWNKETVDSAGCVGCHTSLAFDATGNPAISYYDFGNGDLKYAHRIGTTWNIETVDSEGNVGLYTSLAFDATGNPAISYYDLSNGNLKYAHRIGTTWNTKTVDSEGNVGRDTSLAFDASGNPAISYYDLGNYDLKYAHFVPCKCDAGSPMGCISGAVTKAGTGEPLAGKTVTLRRTSPTPRIRKNVVTDGEGCYRFIDLEAGTYKVMVKSCGGGGTKTVIISGGNKVNDRDFQCR